MMNVRRILSVQAIFAFTQSGTGEDMRLTELRSSAPHFAARKTTARTVAEKILLNAPITALAAYDKPAARLVDESTWSLLATRSP